MRLSFFLHQKHPEKIKFMLWVHSKEFYRNLRWLSAASCKSNFVKYDTLECKGDLRFFFCCCYWVYVFETILLCYLTSSLHTMHRFLCGDVASFYFHLLCTAFSNLICVRTTTKKKLSFHVVYAHNRRKVVWKMQGKRYLLDGIWYVALLQKSSFLLYFFSSFFKLMYGRVLLPLNN